MTRFDSFCLYMIVLCITGAVVVGALQYRDDVGQLEASARKVMPGCRTHLCSIHFERGSPVVDMARNP